MIALACDHGAFELKERVKKHLAERGLDCKDFGCYDTNSCDYADFAAAAARAVAAGECDRGIMLCTTGIGVSHGRGVILLAIAQYGTPLYEYTPNQVKQSVVGFGAAEKRQVMDMTRRLLKMEKVARPDDAADAIAIALCHARSATSRLGALERK